MNILILGLMSLASFMTVDGRGSSSGFCYESQFYFCKAEIIDRAKREALRDADFRCQMYKGRIDSFSGICSDFCSPLSPPNPGTSAPFSVSCQVSCDYRCELETNQ